MKSDRGGVSFFLPALSHAAFLKMSDSFQGEPNRKRKKFDLPQIAVKRRDSDCPSSTGAQVPHTLPSFSQFLFPSPVILLSGGAPEWQLGHFNPDPQHSRRDAQRKCGRVARLPKTTAGATATAAGNQKGDGAEFRELRVQSRGRLR